MGSDVAAAILVQTFFNANPTLLDKNATPETLAERLKPFFEELRKMVEGKSK
jgi:hypothetical protein